MNEHRIKVQDETTGELTLKGLADVRRAEWVWYWRDIFRGSGLDGMRFLEGAREHNEDCARKGAFDGQDRLFAESLRAVLINYRSMVSIGQHDDQPELRSDIADANRLLMLVDARDATDFGTENP